MKLPPEGQCRATGKPHHPGAVESMLTEHIKAVLCIRSGKDSFSPTEETSQLVSSVFREFGAQGDCSGTENMEMRRSDFTDNSYSKDHSQSF